MLKVITSFPPLLPPCILLFGVVKVILEQLYAIQNNTKELCMKK